MAAAMRSLQHVALQYYGVQNVGTERQLSLWLRQTTFALELPLSCDTLDRSFVWGQLTFNLWNWRGPTPHLILCFSKHLLKCHVVLMDPPSSEQPSTPFEFSDVDIHSPAKWWHFASTNHPKACSSFVPSQSERTQSFSVRIGLGDFSELLSATMSSVRSAVKEWIKDSGTDSQMMTNIDSIFNDHGLQTAHMQHLNSSTCNFEVRSIHIYTWIQ